MKLSTTLCDNCGFAKDEHLLMADGALYCIGKVGQYRAPFSNIEANFVFVNPDGVADTYDVVLMKNGRKLARVENVLDNMLGRGCTNISVNFISS